MKRQLLSTAIIAAAQANTLRADAPVNLAQLNTGVETEDVGLWFENAAKDIGGWFEGAVEDVGNAFEDAGEAIGDWFEEAEQTTNEWADNMR